MNEENKLDKRKWEKPQLKVLKIENTFGGTVPAVPEDTTFGDPGSIGS